MAAITVPKEFESAIAQIVTADDSVFNELLSSLNDAPLAFKHEELASNLASKVAGIPSDVLQSMVPALTSLVWVGSNAGVEIQNLVSDVVEGIEKGDLKDALTKSTPEKVKQRFLALLQTRAIRFTSKAREVQKTYGKNFCTAEMLTDIRPVFVEGDEAPMAAMSNHILRITYHERDELRDIFLALTSDDLDVLEDLFEQGRRESAQLRSILDKAGVPYPNGNSNT